MPKRGQTKAITDEDRLRYKAAYDRMKSADPEVTLESVGRQVGLSKGELSKIFNGKSKQSVIKPALDRFFGGSPDNEPVAKRLLAVLRELDDTHKVMLLERAHALLDEQNRTRS